MLDTRSGQGGLQGPLAPNTTYNFYLDRTDLPTDAYAYAFNVTAIHPTGSGNLRFGPKACPYYDCASSSAPTTSLVNYEAGKDVANAVVLAGNYSYDPATFTYQGGAFSLYSDGASVNVAIDVTGYYVKSGAFMPLNPPTRVADTRTSGGTIAANTSRAFQIQAPSTDKAVAINVTAINPSALGNLRIYPDGAAVPTTSNINYIPGVDKAAFVVVQLPANGKIDVYSDGAAVNVAIDKFGDYTSSSTLVTQTPVRVYDSRNGAGELISRLPRDIQIAGMGGVPLDAQAVLVSVTGVHAADSSGIGNLRVYPTGAAIPTVSTLNYVGKAYDVANFAIVPVGTGGKITLYSDGSNVNVLVDVLGYVPAGS